MSLLKEFASGDVQRNLKTSDGSDAGSNDTTSKPADVKFSLMRNMINNNGSVSGSDVNDYLERAHDLNDEVDTVGFAIETDTGDLIKVYVNAQQADQFEQECSKLLGLDDDSEAAINTLAQKFDIVDVVWPQDPGEDLNTEDDPYGNVSIDDDPSNFMDDEDESEVDNIKSTTDDADENPDENDDDLDDALPADADSSESKPKHHKKKSLMKDVAGGSASDEGDEDEGKESKGAGESDEEDQDSGSASDSDEEDHEADNAEDEESEGEEGEVKPKKKKKPKAEKTKDESEEDEVTEEGLETSGSLLVEGDITVKNLRVMRHGIKYMILKGDEEIGDAFKRPNGKFGVRLKGIYWRSGEPSKTGGISTNTVDKLSQVPAFVAATLSKLDEHLRDDVQSQMDRKLAAKAHTAGKYVIDCLMTGGTLGRREYLYQEEGKVKYFDTVEEASACAKELNTKRNHTMARAAYKFTPRVVKEENEMSIGSKFLTRVTEAKTKTIKEPDLYVEFDDDSGMWCVFNENGKALESCSSKEQANELLKNRQSRVTEAKTKTIKIKEPGWYVVDHMDKAVAGPYTESGARSECAEMNTEHTEKHGKGDIHPFDIAYFSDYDIKRAGQKNEGLNEGKSYVEPWAREILDAAGLKIPTREFVFMSDTGDGYWISKAKADAAIEKLRALKSKYPSQKAGTHLAFGKKKGLSFDFDDPDEKGKVGVFFFDETLDEAVQTPNDDYMKAVVSLASALGIPDANLNFQYSNIVRELRAKKQTLTNRSMIEQRIYALIQLIQKGTKQLSTAQQAQAANAVEEGLNESLMEEFGALGAVVGRDLAKYNAIEPASGPALKASYTGSATHEETVLLLAVDPDSEDDAKSLRVGIDGPWDGEIHAKYFANNKDGYKAAVDYANMLRTTELNTGGRPKGWKDSKIADVSRIKESTVGSRFLKRITEAKEVDFDKDPPKTTSEVAGVLAVVCDDGSFSPEQVMAFSKRTDANKIFKFYNERMEGSDQYVEQHKVGDVFLVIWHDHRSDSESTTFITFEDDKAKARAYVKDHLTGQLKLSDVDYITVKK